MTRRSLELLYVCLRHKVAHLAYPYLVIPMANQDDW